MNRYRITVALERDKEEKYPRFETVYEQLFNEFDTSILTTFLNSNEYRRQMIIKCMDGKLTYTNDVE